MAYSHTVRQLTKNTSSPRRPHSGSRLPEGLAAFRHRNYRIFWFAQLVSLTGTWMQSLAQSWLVLEMTDSAFQLGLINVCQFAPTLLFGLVGGVYADRIPKRRLLQVTQTIAGLIVSVLAVLVTLGHVQLWQIYAAALGLGFVNAFDMPARQAFVAEMVGKDDLMNAVALNSALFNTTRVLGPALAGVLLAQVGAAVCFILNAASYAPVVVGLTLMRVAAPKRSKAEGSGLQRIRQGLSYVRSTPTVLLPIVLVGIVATFGMNFNIWVPLLAKRNFDIGAGGFGLLLSSMGVGSLAGALTLAFSGRRPRGRLMLLCAAAFGVFEGGLAIAGAAAAPVLVAVGLMALIGFTMSTTMAMANTTVQQATPDALRGRVMSIYMTVFAGTTPFGALIAGGTAHAFGTPVSVAISGVIVVGAAIGVGIWSTRAAVAAPGGSRASDQVSSASSHAAD
jgi:MFS family permease